MDSERKRLTGVRLADVRAVVERLEGQEDPAVACTDVANCDCDDADGRKACPVTCGLCGAAEASTMRPSSDQLEPWVSPWNFKA